MSKGVITLFTFLDFDTGYNRDNYESYIFKNCNSGMERIYNDKNYILKNPNFIKNIKYIVEDKSIIIKKVIIPIRDYKLSALSRLKHNNNPGGLWHANDLNSQIKFYEHIMANYIYIYYDKI